MKALVVDPARPRTLQFQADYPDPVSAEGEVLVSVLRAGICSTDLEILRGYMAFSGVPGHEFVGVVESGPPALRGRRVVAEINCLATGAGPGDAEQRKHDPARTVLGIAGRDGAFAERVVVPAANCHVVPDAVTDVQAVFVEPLAAALQVLRDCPPVAGQRWAVLGAGRLGLLIAQVVSQQPVDLTVIARNPRSRALCDSWGVRSVGPSADHPPPASLDVVVECTGSGEGLRHAMRLARPRGTVVLKSTYAAPASIDLSPVVIHELRLVGSRCGPFDEALELLERGTVQVDPLVSGCFPLSEAGQAFALAAMPDHIKVLLDPTAE